MRLVTVILLMLTLSVTTTAFAQRQWEEMESELVATDRGDNSDVLDITVKDS